MPPLHPRFNPQSWLVGQLWSTSQTVSSLAGALTFHSCIPDSMPITGLRDGCGQQVRHGRFPRFLMHKQASSINTDHIFPAKTEYTYNTPVQDVCTVRVTKMPVKHECMHIQIQSRLQKQILGIMQSMYKCTYSDVWLIRTLGLMTLFWLIKVLCRTIVFFLFIS